MTTATENTTATSQQQQQKEQQQCRLAALNSSQIPAKLFAHSLNLRRLQLEQAGKGCSGVVAKGD